MKKRNYDLTIWDSAEGTIRIRENFNGCRYYCDVDNRYDQEFDSTEKLEAYLKDTGAEYVGQDSENDW